MRFKTSLLVLVCVCPLLVGCKAKKVMVVSVHGASSSSSNIHNAVEQCSAAYGYPLTLGENWTQEDGDGVSFSGDAEDLRDEINALVAGNGGDESNLSLLVVGKSAGGVLAWNTFKRHYDAIEGFARVALVLVDPHGSVTLDGRTGPYGENQDLWWPDDWSADTEFMRVYNIYQHEDWPTGASFPDGRVYRNTQVTGASVTHGDIPEHPDTRAMIAEALNFAFAGAGPEGVPEDLCPAG